MSFYPRAVFRTCMSHDGLVFSPSRDVFPVPKIISSRLKRSRLGSTLLTSFLIRFWWTSPGYGRLENISRLIAEYGSGGRLIEYSRNIPGGPRLQDVLPPPSGSLNAQSTRGLTTTGVIVVIQLAGGMSIKRFSALRAGAP